MTFDWNYFFSTLWEAVAGIPTTLLITLVAMVIAVPLGLIIALSRLNSVPVLKQLSTLYLSFVRGTPLVVQIFIVYNSMPSLMNVICKALSIEIDVFSINPLYYAFAVFGLNTAASLAETFRSALNAVNKGQLEAGLSIGMTSFKTYMRIIFPQAFLIAIPDMCTVTLSLIKATSLSYIMTVREITGRAKLLANIGYNYIETYLDILIVYLVLCLTLEFVFKTAENRMKKFRGAIVQ